MTARIRELPQADKDQLRSAFLIQSLPACLVELVLNSIDAKARRIEVAFGLPEWECRVTDDGIGVAYQDLQFIGQRYCEGLLAKRRKLTHSSLPSLFRFQLPPKCALLKSRLQQQL